MTRINRNKEKNAIRKAEKAGLLPPGSAMKLEIESIAQAMKCSPLSIQRALAKKTPSDKAVCYFIENKGGTITAGGLRSGDGTITLTKKRWLFFTANLLLQILSGRSR